MASESALHGEVVCPASRAARDRPDAPAIIWSEGAMSWRLLDRRIAAAREAARSLGIGRGSRVAIPCDASPELVILLLALPRLGAVACPLSDRHPTEAIDRTILDLGCTHVVRDATAGPSPPGGVGPREVALAEATPLADPSGPAPPPAAIDPDADATIVCTSGTTSRPKAVVHAWSSHYWSAVGSGENLPFLPGHAWLLSLPCHHVGGLAIVYRAAIAGAAVAIPSDRRDPANEARRLGATHCSLVPTQLWRALRDRRSVTALRGLRAILLGGAPPAPALMRQAAEAGLRVHGTYGLTEMASQVATTPPGADLDALLTAGRVLPHRELKISAEGEILVRGRTLFRGYLGADASPVDPDGWFHTGDLGAVDSEGWLRVVGRRDNLFIAGGENIHPEAIEAVLAEAPGVVESVVVPVDDDEYGRRPLAFVRTETGERPDAAALARLVATRLPRFMVPRGFFPFPDPEGGLKPDRRALAELAARFERRHAS